MSFDAVEAGMFSRLLRNATTQNPVADMIIVELPTAEETTMRLFRAVVYATSQSQLTAVLYLSAPSHMLLFEHVLA